MKKIISITAAAMLLTTSAYAQNNVLDEAAEYVRSTVTEPQVGSIGGEWAVFGLARSGMDIEDSYFSDYYSRVEEYTRAHKGVLDERKYTEYSRLVIALTSIGRDPRNVGGYNLLSPLGDFEKTAWQGLNGSVFALIALDCGDYEVPYCPTATVQATREMYVSDILSHQEESGGFVLSEGAPAEIDITAMALTALSGYMSDFSVREAIDKSLNYLSEQQQPSGGYIGIDGESSENAAQVVVAMSALGVSDSDPRFVKNGNSVYDNLLSFRCENGGFSHTRDGEVNAMASEQALYAMCAYGRAKNGRYKLYSMEDVTGITEQVTEPESGLPGKHEAIKPVPYKNSVTFKDVEEAQAKAKVEELASRGIINGRAEGSFAPSDTMTRAEYAAIVVRGLGLDTVSTDKFTDVSESDWFMPYVSTAVSYGIVNGVSQDEFFPQGTITREQAAAMTARAAALCGMNTELSDNEIKDMLAQFGDYMSVSDWARESLAFCYKSGILSQEDIDIEPKRAILRYEIAEMLYNMLAEAQIL